MKIRVFLILAIFLAPFALGQMWEATRIGNQQWELSSDTGAHISWHQSEAEAVEKGQAWSIDNSFRNYVTRHTGTRWESTAFAQAYPGGNNSTPDTAQPPSYVRTWTNAVATDPETGLSVDGWIVVVRFDAAPPVVYLDSGIAVGTLTYNFSSVPGIEAASNAEWRVYSTINGYAAAPVTTWQAF